ncbi:hypothetical protein [Lysobacter terrae]
MSKGIDPAYNLVGEIFDGGLRTARLFDKATGGCRLDQACEYLLTAGIFERLAQRHKGAVLLEVPVRSANKEASAVPRGRPSKKGRTNGRYDLVHYWANGKPRAVIEVKSPIRNAVRGSFDGDLARISRTLTASAQSSYQFGALVFFATKDYSSKCSEMREKRRDAKERLNELMSSVSVISKDHVGSSLFRRVYKSKVQYSRDADEGAWQLGMVLLAAKSRQATFPHDLMD